MQRNETLKVDILILTVIPVERDAVLRQLGSWSPHCVQPPEEPTHFQVDIPISDDDNPIRVAVAMLPGMGNTAASTHLSQLSNRLKPRCVFMVGIAGGFDGRVGLGDVVVADQIGQYELSKVKPEGDEARPEWMRSDPIFLDRSRHVSNDWLDKIVATRPQQGAPKLSIAPILSGEKVIADAEAAHRVRKLHGKSAAVDMESFGVAWAASQFSPPMRFLAIRGISDLADAGKNDNWHEYAADAAAAFAVHLLVEYVAPMLADELKTHAVKANRDPSPRQIVAIRHCSMDPFAEQAIHDQLPTDMLAYREVSIDQSDLYRDGRMTNPLVAVQRQVDKLAELNRMLDEMPDAELAYYGIAHIPLHFLLGYQLSNKRSVRFYEHNRNSPERKWDLLTLNREPPPLQLRGMPNETVLLPDDVVLRVSISFRAWPHQTAKVVGDALAELDLEVPTPTTDLVTSHTALESYSQTFRKVLDDVIRYFPHLGRLHVFYAGPASLALNFGRQISKTLHPDVIVYNFVRHDEPEYSWGLRLKADPNSEEMLVVTTGKGAK